MKWLIILTLAVAITPAAFAQTPDTPQVVETIGPNYDLTEDYINGLATWSSHPERIMFDGEWKDFAVIQSGNSIQVASNSVGTLVYDLQSCSYSLYESGYADTQLIPAVSWMPRIAQVGTDNYSQLDDLYNAQCDVQVSQGENWVNIKSVKTQTEDLDPVVIVHANGTQSVYPSGTRDIATTTQTLDIRTDNGIKETVSVFNGNPEWNNHKFALSQTIHTGDSITLGGQTYDIAGASGTVLDRQWIEDNEAQIFEIADSLNYDFDVGIQQLNAIQILDDFGTYKVAMDFSVNDSTPYLSSYTVDPTFTSSASSQYERTAHSGTTGTSCPTANTQSSQLEIVRYDSSTSGYCTSSYTEWDVSNIPDGVVIQSASVSFTSSPNSWGVNNVNCDITGNFATQPSTASTSANLESLINNGYELVDNNNWCQTSGTINLTLNGFSLPDGQDWYATGYKYDSLVRNSDRQQTEMSNAILEVTYLVLTQPSSPTNLSATSGQPIDLSWTASSDLGGAQTSDMTYKVERSTYEFAESPLPINAGSDSAVDMSTNVLLYHLDATKIDATTSVDSSYDGTSTNNNSPSTVSGKIGKGWEMTTTNSPNSSGDYIALAKSPLQAGLTQFTINYWMEADTTSFASHFQQGSSGNDLIGHLCAVNSTNCEVYVSNGSLAYYQLGNYPYSANTWHMVTIVFDGTQSTANNRVKIYIDGTQHTGGSYSGTFPTSIGGSVDPFHMGARGTNGYSSGDNTFDGIYDEWAFWDIPLTQANINSLYNSGSAVASNTVETSNLIAYYDFEQTSTTLENQAETTTYSDPYIEDTSGANNDSENPAIITTNTDSLGSSADATSYNLSQNSATNFVGKNSLDFTGSTNSYLDLGTSLNGGNANDIVSNTGAWTFSAWVNVDTTSPSSHETVLSKIHNNYQSGAEHELFIRQSTNGKFMLYSSTAGSIESNSGVSTGWHNLIATVNGNDWTLYVDNDSGSTFTGTSTNWNSNEPWFVGGQDSDSTNNPNQRMWDGQMQEIGFWNRALTSDERTALQTNTIADSGVVNGLLTYYTLNNGDVTNQASSVQSTSNPTFSTGTIANQIDSPQITVKSSTLFDGTDPHSVAGWTKAVSSAIGTLLSFENTSGETIYYEIETDKVRVAKSSTTTVTQSSGGTSSSAIYYVNSGWQRQFLGQEFNTGHTLIGKSITSVTLQMEHNNPNAVYKLVKLDSSDTKTDLEDVDMTWVASNGGLAEYVFDNFTPFTLNAGDKIGIYADGVTGGNSGNWIKVEMTGTDVDSNANLYQIHDTSTGDVSGDLKYTIGYGSTTNIIEATGQSISTSTPSHVMFTRDTSNGWEIFLDGTSIQTATNSVDLGTPTKDRDSSYDGTNNGATTGQTGKIGNAWSFDGTNDWVDLGTTLNSKIDGNPFTISSWAYVTATNISDRTVIGKQIAGYSSPYHVLNLRAYNGDWTLATNDGSNYQSCSNAIDSTGWTHLAVQYDGTSTFELFENGVSACTISASNTNWSTSYWSIGNGEGTTRYFNDKIDQVLFYDSDSVSISDLYNSGSGTATPSTTNLIAHYDFEQSGDLENQTYLGDEKYYIGQSPTGTNVLPSLDEFIIFTSDKGAEADDIYQRGANTFSQVGTTTGSTVTFSDNNSLVSGDTYYHRIVANNGAFDSDPSNVSSATAGTPPDPPTSVQTSITDTDANPLDILITWSSPSNVGTGTLTGFEIYRDSTLITTTGLVSSYTDTVPNSGTFVYSLKAVSTHGSSSMSNTSSQTTPTAPAAITDLSATAVSNVQADLSWSAPSDGGSSITQFKILRDSVNIANTTSTSYSDSSLSDGTTYLYNVFSQNNVGTSIASNSESVTTHTGVSGGITGTATTIGATSQLIVNATVTAGTPTPNFNTFVVKEGANVITTFTGTTGYIHHTDESPHTYTIESTDSSHWQQPTISGTISGVTSQYSPTWVNNAAYNFTRGGGTFDLTVNRDIPAGWDLDCEYRTSTQAAANQTGVHGIGSNMWAYSDTQSIADGKHVYVTCMDGNTQVVSFTSYGPNLIQGGLNLLDTNFGDYLGAPAALLFVLLAAGMFTGRTANTGILVVLALIGVLGFIGMLAIDETVWGFVLIAGVLGLFVGRRFL